MYVFGSNIYLVYTTAVCESVCVCAIVPVLALLCVSPPTNRTTHIPSLAVSAATRPRVLATARDLSYPILSYPILSYPPAWGLHHPIHAVLYLVYWIVIGPCPSSQQPRNFC